MPKKMMFARLDFSTFLVCCSGDLSDNESDEKPSVAICGGSICILTGLKAQPVLVASWGQSTRSVQSQVAPSRGLAWHYNEAAPTSG